MVPTSWGSSSCIKAGQAGSLAATDDAVYWVDTAGNLGAKKLSDGQPSAGWPEYIHLPTLVGGAGSKGFTNTEPSIDTKDNALVVTLRNYVAAGETNPDGSRLWLRGCHSDFPVHPCSETGAPGIAIALHLDRPTVKWTARLKPEGDPAHYPSINTAALILSAQNSVLFGDVNGVVHSYALNTDCERSGGTTACDPARGQPWSITLTDGCDSQNTIDLLSPTETPARGKETWSQVSGVGTDPMLVASRQDENPLVLMGVNYAPPSSVTDPDREAWRYGRLVAFRALNPYNLKWSDPSPSSVGQVAPGKGVVVEGTIDYELANLPLGELRSLPVPVRWLVSDSKPMVPKAGGRFTGRDLGYATALPANFQPWQSLKTSATVVLQPDDPPEGYIVGVIDSSEIVRRGGVFGVISLALRDAFGLQSPPCPGTNAAEVARTATGQYSQLEGFADNFLYIPYTLQTNPNLKLTVDAPATVPFAPGTTYTATFHITNEGTTEVTVPLAVTARARSGTAWSLGTRSVTVGPGETVTQTRKVSVLGCGDTVTVTGTLNPEPRTLDEPSYEDNSAAAATKVGACDAPPDLGAFSGGDGDTIIVPADCVPNPDITSDHPCVNYPHLTITR